jgi:hypothetical protein
LKFGALWCIIREIKRTIMEDRFYPDEMFIAAEKAHKQLTHEEMLEIAEEKEKLHAGFKKNENGEWYRPTLQELTRNERIDLAEKEIAYLVMGGQDMKEYVDSISFIMDVLNSLKDKEDTEFKDSAEGVA